MKATMNGKTHSADRKLAALLGAFALASVAQAQRGEPEYPAYSDDVRQTVARVAYFSGDVSYSRGDDPDTWQPASINFPMTLGDHLYTARDSRLELQIGGGSIYLAPETDMAALNLTDDAKQFSLVMGSASFRVPFVDSGHSFEVDTPNSAVTFDRPGEYRIDVDRDGNSRVIVTRGHAYVAAAGGEVPLDSGSLMSIEGIDSPVYDVTLHSQRDSWDQWVSTRSRRYPTGVDRRYVSANISGADDLNAYGQWSQVQGYGTVWSPSNVSADWQPYRAGRWVWEDPWGWSWVSNEPWGWAPYHYGRWINSDSRWYWVPVGPEVQAVRYAPALVGFVGGPGFSLSVSAGGGPSESNSQVVSWFPLGPRDPYVPSWGSSARTTNVTNATYVNRNYVTVVDHDTFVSGAPVGRNVIRDERTVHEISTAPVARGPIPVTPTAASIRVSTELVHQVPRPPTETIDRSVVTRRAPAAAPALFRDKEGLIRENRGSPVAPVDAARIPVENRIIRPTRSVVAPEGRIALTPKHVQGSTPVPVPVIRDLPPGQARRAPKPEGTLPTAADKPNQSQAEAASKPQQEQQADIDAQRQQVKAGYAREQQQAEANAKRQQQEQAAAAYKQQQAQQAAATSAQQQAEAAKARQQQQQAEANARRQMQAQAAADAKQKQEQANQASQLLREQQADAARKQQQEQETIKRQQEQAAATAATTQQSHGAAPQQPPAANHQAAADKKAKKDQKKAQSKDKTPPVDDKKPPTE